MKTYFMDADQMELLRAIEKFLYSDSALKVGYIDKKRDMANALNYLLHQLENQTLSE